MSSFYGSQKSYNLTAQLGHENDKQYTVEYTNFNYLSPHTK